jgi:hypothetical protein
MPSSVTPDDDIDFPFDGDTAPPTSFCCHRPQHKILLAGSGGR